MSLHPKLQAMLDRCSTHNDIKELAYGDNRAYSNRTAAEEEAGASLPGDPVDPNIANPYVRLAAARPLQVKRLIESGQLSPEDQQLAVEALALFSALDGQPVWGQRRP